MLDHLTPGSHLCQFYESEEERYSTALDFIKQGLKSDEYVVILGYDPLNDPFITSQTMDPLIQAGLNEKKLIIFSKTVETLYEGDFDVDQFTDWLTKAVEITSHYGESSPNFCVRVLAQMNMILRGSPDVGQLETYEDLVNQYFTTNRCIVLCQYDRFQFSAHLLNEALLSHPALIVKDEYLNNFYYIPPANKNDEDLASARFDQWIDNLLRSHQTEKELYLTHTWIEGASDMVLWVDEEGKIIYINSTACQRLKYAKSELLSLNIQDIEPQRNMENWKKEWREMKEKGSITQDVVFFTRSGQTIPVDLRRTFLTHNGHEISCAIARDISEHIRRERLQQAIFHISEAANSARSQQALFKTVHEIVATLIPARNLYIALFDAVKDMVTFPYFIDEYDTKPAPRKEGKGLTEYLIRTGKPLLYSPNIDFNLRDHGILYVGTYSPSWMGAPLKTADGRIIGSLVVQSYDYEIKYSDEDLTILTFVSSQIAMAIERQHNEEALRHSEKNFRLLVEGIKDYAAFMLDVNGNVISWNSGAERLHGYQAQDIIGKNVSVFYIDTDRERNMPHFELSLAARKGSFEHESWRLRKNGSRFYTNIVINALYDHNGDVYGYVTVVRDISARAPSDNHFRDHRPSLLDDF